MWYAATPLWVHTSSWSTVSMGCILAPIKSVICKRSCALHVAVNTTFCSRHITAFKIILSGKWQNKCKNDEITLAIQWMNVFTVSSCVPPRKEMLRNTVYTSILNLTGFVLYFDIISSVLLLLSEYPPAVCIHIKVERGLNSSLQLSGKQWVVCFERKHQTRFVL